MQGDKCTHSFSYLIYIIKIIAKMWKMLACLLDFKLTMLDGFL